MSTKIFAKEFLLSYLYRAHGVLFAVSEAILTLMVALQNAYMRTCCTKTRMCSTPKSLLLFTVDVFVNSFNIDHTSYTANGKMCRGKRIDWRANKWKTFGQKKKKTTPFLTRETSLKRRLTHSSNACIIDSRWYFPLVAIENYSRRLWNHQNMVHRRACRNNACF